MRFGRVWVIHLQIGLLSPPPTLLTFVLSCSLDYGLEDPHCALFSSTSPPAAPPLQRMAYYPHSHQDRTGPRGNPTASVPPPPSCTLSSPCRARTEFECDVPGLLFPRGCDPDGVATALWPPPKKRLKTENPICEESAIRRPARPCRGWGETRIPRDRQACRGSRVPAEAGTGARGLRVGGAAVGRVPACTAELRSRREGLNSPSYLCFQNKVGKPTPRFQTVEGV